MNQRPLIGITSSILPVADWGDSRLKLDRDGQGRQYSESVAMAGGIPLILPLLRTPMDMPEEGYSNCGPGNLFDNARVYVERLDGLILAGGGDVAPSKEARSQANFREVDRSRDIWESALLAAALEMGKPVLGICRGAQVMNMALGGTLWEDLPSQCPGPVEHFQKLPRARAAHEVFLEPGTRLAKALNFSQFMVNSGHHQGIRDLAPSLIAAAKSKDGLIEAVEHKEAAFAVGVPLHPEGTAADLHSRALFAAFVMAAEQKQ